MNSLSNILTAYEPKNNTETEVQFEVPLTNLSGPSGAGDIKYKLSYLKPGDTLANGDPLPTPIDKAFIKTLCKLPFLVFVFHPAFQYGCGGIGANS